MSLCPCGSQLDYASCCGQYHNHFNAPTALNLMRSRYSAFCMGNIDYISKTMRGKASLGFNIEETKAWASSVYWLGLEIIASSTNTEDPNTAYVEFIARFLQKDRIQHLHEKSEFNYIDGQWYYVGGIRPVNQHSPKTLTVSRNAPCPCNSNKKFKNCHGMKL